MKAQELRIGNLLQDVDGNIVEVITVYANGNYEVNSKIHQFTIIEKDDNLIEPIPLTEEWLLKFGFEFQKGFINDDYWHLKNLHLSKRFQPFNQQGALIRYELQYLHQLQNLFFALTGEELELK